MSELVREKLATAPTPLPLKDVLKGLPKPPKARKKKGESAPEPVSLEDAVRAVLDDEQRAGRAFRYPSGKGGADRFWASDERQRLRDEAVKLAATPKPLTALRTAAGKAVKGTDPGFAEGVLRDLIGEAKLFEYPAKAGKGGPLFGATPPPPPVPTLEQAKFKKKVDALAKTARSLLAAAKVSADELLEALGVRLGGTSAEVASPTVPPSRRQPP